MSAQNFTEFNLPKDAYAAFDATSLKSLIIQRLKTSNVFTDQAFEGSNLSAIIDIIAYSYHVSLFYLNNQAAESYFSQSALLENMNKLVNLIGYNPLGSQTSIASFDAAAGAGLTAGNYIIPRFSFVAANGVFYSVSNDIYFEKTTNGAEDLQSIGSQNLLYQGQFREYPTQTAAGAPFEIITMAIESIVTNADSFVDYSNIFVFVKDATTQLWSEWNLVESLFNEQTNSKSFEKRLNDAGRYELKFGDDINGKKLNANDLVAVYYLQSNGSQGVIAAQAINDAALVRFTTPRFREISSNIYEATDPIVTQDQLNAVFITNTNKSTDPKSLETVQEIRENAPRIFSAQNRAVTTVDFDAFAKRNFANLIRDVKTISNSEYVNAYMKYFYDIGLKQPNDDSRVLLNQVSFADACDFNNVYMFVVPRNFVVQNSIPQTLSTNLKQLIVNQMQSLQMQSTELVPSDPVYIAVDVAVAAFDEPASVDLREKSVLVIQRARNSKITPSQIKANALDAMLNFFDINKMKLGMTLDFFALTKDLLAIAGVEKIFTKRIDKNVETPGVSFVLWNPLYSVEDVSITSQNIALPSFKYPFLIDSNKLSSKIMVI
jgi:hypothetical protein